MEAVIAVSGIVATFLSLTIIIYVFFTTRNKERLALIARNKDASIFKSRSRKYRSERLGILLIFFGIGIFIAVSLVNLGIIGEEVAVLAICPIFVGIGLLVSGRLYQSQEEEEDLEV